MDSGQRFALEGALQNKRRAKPANRLTDVIVLILILAASIAFLVSAILAIVNLNLP